MMSLLTVNVRLALRSLNRNRMRTLLTMLGIIIGVSSVIGILAIGNGWGQYFESELGARRHDNGSHNDREIGEIHFAPEFG